MNIWTASSLTPITTPNMVDHYFECNKLEASTPAQVQNHRQKITYNHDNLVQIKEEMVKDKRYKRIGLRHNKDHKEIKT